MSELLTNNWRSAQRISDVLSFTASMSNTPAIASHFIELSCVTALILRTYYDEGKSQAKMTLNNLHPAIRSWLAAKGFTREEDIKQLEQSSSSLTRALLALLLVLPGPPKQFRITGKRQRLPPSKTRSSGHISESKLASVRVLLEALQKHFQDGQPGDIEDTGNADGAEIDLPLTDTVDAAPLAEDLGLAVKEDLERAALSTDAQGKYYMHLTDSFVPIIQSDRLAWTRKYAIEIKANVLATQSALLSGREYKASKPRGGFMSVCVHTYIKLRIAINPELKAEDISGDKIWICAEIAPAGETHPNSWATSARPDDPATRLAFSVRVPWNKDVFFYATTGTGLDALKGNAFVD
ncbi:hypothetical protein BDW74DRAFT_148904 [Aspergillus multicolor]|uniref:uncharacterized protein n=1 Tax=Aspergillus multicolor TaxID=41759 RepID=UPI003CCD9010